MNSSNIEEINKNNIYEECLVTLEERIYEHSLSLPCKPAIIGTDGSFITYDQLKERIFRAFNSFCKRGLKKGDHIILSAEKSIEFVSLYFGAHWGGITTFPLDPETNSVRIKKIMEAVQPKYILGDFRHLGENESVNYQSFLEVNQQEKESLANLSLENVADVMFTTGTTSDPKGVMLTNLNEAAAARNINQFIGNKENDIEMLALPISHSFGLGRLRAALSNGQTVVFVNGFASMKKFFGAIEKYGVTGFGMVPASWAYLSKMSGDRIAQYSHQLKYIEIGSAFLPLEEKERLMRLLPETKICMHYGLTEASRSTFISFHEEADFLQSAGKPSPNCQVAIFSSEGVKLPVGKEGEICVNGDHVCSGYFNSSEEIFNKDSFQGYFRTGDWGLMDENGYVYLKSRTKEMINVGGKKVSPMEVEEILNSYPGIEESACVGYKDEVLGEVVKAFVTGSTASEDDKKIIEFVSQNLENYKVPVYISHIDSLPKTSSGKIQRLKLKG